MKVVILCGGEGTRLKEETEFKPKPLVEVGGMPILWHIMKIYAHYGHKEFILPLGYKGELIKQFFVDFNWRANDFTLNFMDKKINVHENHKNEDWVIHFVDTGLKTLTGLRLKKVESFIKPDKEFMLTYGDGVADIDINKLIDFHRESNADITLSGIKISSKFGVLNIENNKLTQFEEKPITNDRINGGFMVINSNVFEIISNKNIMLESSDGPITQLALKNKVAVYPHDGVWYCMDTYRDYKILNEVWENNPKWKIWK